MKKITSLFLILLMLVACVSCAETDPVDDTKKSYVFQSGEISVTINAEAAPIITALGTWLDYNESPSCAFDGLDKVYIYAGFRIQTYPENGKDYIYSVELTDDSVTTPEGITIGSEKDQVISVYGAADKASDTDLTYTDDANGMYLQFLLRNGSVTNILYVKKDVN